MANFYPGAIPSLTAGLSDSIVTPADWLQVTQELYLGVMPTLGVNPHVDTSGINYGDVASRLQLVQDTAAASAAIVFQNVQIFPNVTTPATKLSLSGDAVGIEGFAGGAFFLTIDLTVSGKNGTAAARAANTTYYVWLGYNPTTGVVCGLLDTTSARGILNTSHASLAGFTRWRRIGIAPTDGSQNFYQFHQHGRHFVFQDDTASMQLAAFINNDTNFHDFTIPLAPPAVIRHVEMAPIAIVTSAGAGTTPQTIFARTKGSSANGQAVYVVMNTGGGGPVYQGITRMFVVVMDASGIIQLKWNSFSINQSVTFAIRGWWDLAL